jgi:hypothetical protein
MVHEESETVKAWYFDSASAAEAEDPRRKR